MNSKLEHTQTHLYRSHDFVQTLDQIRLRICDTAMTAWGSPNS